MATDDCISARRKRALVTGVSGFTGPHLVRLLAGLGLDVVGVDRVQHPDGLRDVSGNLDLVRVDLRDAPSVRSLVCEYRPDYIFHLAALCRSQDLQELFALNVLATENVLDAAAGLQSASVFIPGSAAELGIINPEDVPLTERQPLRPVSAYGLSKAAQVMRALAYWHARGLRVFVGRSFNLLGPDAPESMVCSAIAARIVAAEHGRGSHTIRVTQPYAERDFIDIRDAVRAYWAIVTNGRPGEVYNVCSGVSTAVGRIAAAMIGMSDVPLELELDRSPRRADDVPVSLGDPSKLMSETGWTPRIPLRESLAGVLVSYRAKARSALATSSRPSPPAIAAAQDFRAPSAR